VSLAAVFMDEAYDSAPRREALAEAGIMHRGHARRPLTAWQGWMNVALAPIRGQVERTFGTLKRSYGWRRVRYRGLLRNGAHLHLLCTAMNLRRAERLPTCVPQSATRHRNRHTKAASRPPPRLHHPAQHVS
jgi:IS5 family transposase